MGYTIWYMNERASNGSTTSFLKIVFMWIKVSARRADR